jgi:hypothetical protein
LTKIGWYDFSLSLYKYHTTKLSLANMGKIKYWKVLKLWLCFVAVKVRLDVSKTGRKCY